MSMVRTRWFRKTIRFCLTRRSNGSSTLRSFEKTLGSVQLPAEFCSRRRIARPKSWMTHKREVGRARFVRRSHLAPSVAAAVADGDCHHHRHPVLGDQIESAVHKVRSGPSVPTMNGASVPSRYCLETTAPSRSGQANGWQRSESSTSGRLA